MPSIIDQKSQQSSEYNQASFLGGMNLLLDDTHLAPNQYRIGFNVRNRYDRLDAILSSVEDVNRPAGVIQELVTFGNYEILFVSGLAYYKLYTDIAWVQILGFSMDPAAPRYWTKAVPVSTTNYIRFAATTGLGGSTAADSHGPVNINNVAGASQGNLPGLLVQDNINQPQFIFLDVNGIPSVRTTQTFAQWNVNFTDGTGTIIGPAGGPKDSTKDQREYVPIGNVMEFVDGVLYIASKDGNLIYRSVSGRPLDFVINVTNLLPAGPNFNQIGGGDATTTAYSVGVGPISCLRAMSDNSLFVAAGNANFRVAKNMTQNAPLIFGEYTFIRTFLFNANCMSDRAIIDSLGDTRFVDLTGIRSFNAISQLQNEGRNSVFSSQIQEAFTTTNATSILQNPLLCSAILFDNYELYGIDSKFGPVIAVYDTINSCWVGFDTLQTNGHLIKQLVKIELAVQALFAVTDDNKLYRLYVGPKIDAGSIRTVGISAGLLWAGNQVKLANPRMEIKLAKVRAILNNITANCTCSITPYVNNRMSSIGKVTKNITFEPSPHPTTGILSLSDVDTQLKNLFWPTPNCEQGWKIFILLEWSGGSITQLSSELNDLTPQNPLNSQ